MELLNISGPHPPLRRPAAYRETHLSLLSHWKSKDNLRHEDDISAQIKDHFQISRFVQDCTSVNQAQEVGHIASKESDHIYYQFTKMFVRWAL